MTLEEFVAESNRIEGIHTVLTSEVDAHKRLLDEDFLTVQAVEAFVMAVAQAPLRSKRGMDVVVGRHLPPPGGSGVPKALRELLDNINASDALRREFGEYGENELTPFRAHVLYESLHPFMDGNGRSGRAIWLYSMERAELSPLRLGFLHNFYYQALAAGRAP